MALNVRIFYKMKMWNSVRKLLKDKKIGGRVIIAF